MCVPVIHNMPQNVYTCHFEGSFCLFSIRFWPPKPYPKFWGLESQKLPKFWVWNGSGKIGVWNTSVLVGRKKIFPVLKPPTSHPNLFLILYIYMCVRVYF